MNLPFLIAPHPRLEEPKVVVRKVTAMSNRLAQEERQAVDEETRLDLLIYRIERDVFEHLAQCRSDDLVGIDDQCPVGFELQIIKGPVFLFRETEPVVVNDFGPMGFGDLLGLIGRSTVDDEDLVRPTLECLKAEADVGFFILRDDQDIDQTATSQGDLKRRKRDGDFQGTYRS